MARGVSQDFPRGVKQTPSPISLQYYAKGAVWYAHHSGMCFLPTYTGIFKAFATHPEKNNHHSKRVLPP